jgi:hypothetical protein
MKVVRTMEQAASEFKGENPDQAPHAPPLGGIGRSRTSVGGIQGRRDQEGRGGVTLHVAYDRFRAVHRQRVAGCSFDKTVKVQ